jgi:4-alpha-glucanotransferase
MSERLAGLLLPAFSPRRAGDLGIGDTRCLKEWIDLAAESRIAFLQLLPINETGADDSPYNAISSVALEFLYLTMEDVPGLTEHEIAAGRTDLGEASVRVRYASVRRVKRALLDLAWSRFDRETPEFTAFREEQASWLEEYTTYKWLMEQAGGSEVWDIWPEEFRTAAGGLARLEKARQIDEKHTNDRLAFHAWVQWLCFSQWENVHAHADARGVKLMGDIPIGVSRYSADVFFNREDFDLEWCGGAPPERVFKYDRFIQRWGQNWGIPLYHWDRMEAAGFPWWRQRISKLTEIFHIFRIDHVLGFYRIYSFPWQPKRNAEFLELTEREAALKTGGPLPRWSPRPDDTEPNCNANRSDGETRLRMIQEAAGESAVVAEDLGFVPPYVRPHLQSLGIAGFRIPHWDEDEDGHVVKGENFPECSFATYATHDHDSIPAMWIALQTTAALKEGDEDEIGRARDYLRRMAEFAGLKGKEPYGPKVRAKLLDAILASHSRYAAIMTTDLIDSTDRINSPGTVGPQNWSWRIPLEASVGEPLADLRIRIEQSQRVPGPQEPS